jgi:hypothetical protein
VGGAKCEVNTEYISREGEKEKKENLKANAILSVLPAEAFTIA